MTDQTRALTRYDGPRTVDELERYSRTLAVNALPDGTFRRNDALPAIFRGNPAAVAFAVEYAKALDVSPITAVIGIHIVDGKPTASSGLISALVRRAGHKIRTWLEGSISEGTAVAYTTIVRSDDPDFTYRSEWTLDRAVRAELMKRTDDGRIVAMKPGSGWAKYPENMLKARSITECARDAAEDAILGVHYTPEELGVDVDETGDPVYTVTQVPTRETGTPQTVTPPAETVTPPRGEEPTTPPRDELIEDVRVAILDARTGDDLVAVWNWTLPGIGPVGDHAASLETADENGVETTVRDLFVRAGQAIKAGTHLTAGRDDDGDTNDGPADGSPGDGGNGPESGDNGSGDGGREVTVDEAVAKGRGDDVVDAVIVEEEGTGGDPVPSGTPYRDQLDRVVVELRKTPGHFEALVGYCQLEQLVPDAGEEACRLILEAIESGVALPAAVDPVKLLEVALGATVISTERISGEEAHRRELEERREEARRATPAGNGPAGSGRDAFRAARASGTPSLAN